MAITMKKTVKLNVVIAVMLAGGGHALTQEWPVETGDKEWHLAGWSN